MGLISPPKIDKLIAKKDMRSLIKVLEYPKAVALISMSAYTLGTVEKPLTVGLLITAQKDSAALHDHLPHADRGGSISLIH